MIAFAILVILVIFLAVVFFGVVIYNKLVRLRNTVKASWSDIDVQLKKRYDLVPNLVETVKGYASHEKSVFEKVTTARSMAMNASSPADKAKAENMLAGTLKSLFCGRRGVPRAEGECELHTAPVTVEGTGR